MNREPFSVEPFSVLVAFAVRSDILAQSTAVPTGWAPQKTFLRSPLESIMKAVLDKTDMISALSIIAFWTAVPKS